VDFNRDHVTPTNTGQSVLVIDLAAFAEPATFKAALDRLVQDLRGGERLPGVDRIWLPGEQSHLKRQKYTNEGIPFHPGQISELAALADALGIAQLT
jgi:L-2-hydroxycarboxylate dehydrogenase (NAD+)